MALQLMTLAVNSQHRRRPYDVRQVDGRLFYKLEGAATVVWGNVEYRAPGKFKIARHGIIDGKLWTLERDQEGNQDVMVFDGVRGVAYPFKTIEDQVLEAGGKPVYRVFLNWAHEGSEHKKFPKDQRESFVVWGTEEGKRYSFLSYLWIIKDKPAYRAAAIEVDGYLLVWGTTEVVLREHVGRPLNHNEDLVAVVYGNNRRDPKSLVRFKSDGHSEVIATSHDLGSPAVIAGQLVYYTHEYDREMSWNTDPNERAVVHWGDRQIVCRRVEEWNLWQDPDSMVFVFCAHMQDGSQGTWINFQPVSDELYQGNSIHRVRDGVVRLRHSGAARGDDPTEYNLAELGILSAAS